MENNKKEVRISTPVSVIFIIVVLIIGVMCFCLGRNVANMDDNKTTSTKEVVTEKKENDITTTKKIIEDNESNEKQSNSDVEYDMDESVEYININGERREATVHKGNLLEVITIHDSETDIDEIISLKIGEKIITYYDHDKNKIINGFKDSFASIDVFKDYYLISFYMDEPDWDWYFIIYDKNGNEIFNNRLGLNKDGSRATKKFGTFFLDNYTRHENDNLINLQYISNTYDYYSLTKSDCNTIKKNNAIGYSVDIVFESDKVTEKNVKQLHFNELAYYDLFKNKCKEVGVTLK